MYGFKKVIHSSSLHASLWKFCNLWKINSKGFSSMHLINDGEENFDMSFSNVKVDSSKSTKGSTLKQSIENM